MIALLIWLGGLALVALVWLLFRSGGYKRQPLDHSPGPGWTRTEERFVDPSSGETLEVWYRPDRGERQYVRAQPESARRN